MRSAVARHQDMLALGAASALAALLGTALAMNAELMLIGLCAVLLGFAILAAPPTMLVVVAVVAAITFRGLATLGLLPALATYASIPLAWGALAAALLRATSVTKPALHVLTGLGAVFAVTLVSAALDGSEALRPLFYFALLGEPFAIVAALLLDRGSASWRRTLKLTLAALIAIQLPVALLQFAKFGLGDQVQGTLHGSEAGAHLAGALAVLGFFWWVSANRGRWTLSAIAAGAALLVIPVLADAKQVIAAVPAVLLLRSRATRLRRQVAAVLVVVGIFVLVLLIPALGGFYVAPSLERTFAGNSGKVIAVEEVWEELRSSPAELVFGAGPARTVSHAAVLTTDPIVYADSPVEMLDLEPSGISYGLLDYPASGSFDSGRSSGIGLIGDLGLLGAAAYAALFLAVFVPVRRSRSGAGAAATAALVLFALLGFVNDWWEQSAFTVPVAALVGLALAPEAEARERGSVGTRRESRLDQAHNP